MSAGNDLPKGWSACTLGDLVEIIRGVSYKKQQATAEPGDGRVPILRATNINQSVDFDGLVYVPQECVSEEQMLQPGDIVVAASSGSRSVVGKAAQVIEQWLGSFGAFCMGLRPNPAIESNFVAFFLQTQEYRHTVSLLSSGSNINNLKRDHIQSFPFRLAPLGEQRRIVAKIEELFSDLDAGVAALERAKANLKRYRAAVLKVAVEGRLVPSAGEASVFSKPAWHVISTAIESLEQGWSPRCERNPSGNPETWGVIKTSAVQHMSYVADENKKLPDSLPPRPKLEVGKNDLLITRAGPRKRCGVCCLVKRTRPRLIVCDKVYRLRADTKKATPGYLEVALNAPQILDELDVLKSGISDSGVNLTQGRFRKLRIPLPTLQDQVVIVSEVERLLSLADKTANVLDRAISMSERLRQCLLKRAFEGKLVPQDPSDEPADKLLASIRQDRERRSARPKPRTRKARRSAKKTRA
ncbi:MAG TPA: restriction endonuclease subunit S [Phycisphaerae bacterium]|nr:restriction endonuclease subunit S [Phycisphaerae bacterium]